MNAWPMRGRLPSSAKNESASVPIAAPVSAAQISSNISASIAPFAPPIGNRLPRSIASFGSVVGLPSASSAQPSGMRSPLRIAIMMRPRTTVVRARSMTSGSLPLRGNTAATGLVPNSAFLPPQAGIAAGELVKAKPTSPACGDRQQVDAQHADVRAVADAGEGDAVAPRALDHLLDRPLRRDIGQAVAVVDQAHAGALGDHRRLRGAVGAALAQHAAVERHARHAVRGQAVLLGANQVARGGFGHAIICPGPLERGARQANQRLRVFLHNEDSNHGQDDRAHCFRRPQAGRLPRRPGGQAARRHRRDPGDLRRQQPHQVGGRRLRRRRLPRHRAGDVRPRAEELRRRLHAAGHREGPRAARQDHASTWR